MPARHEADGLYGSLFGPPALINASCEACANVFFTVGYGGAHGIGGGAVAVWQCAEIEGGEELRAAYPLGFDGARCVGAACGCALPRNPDGGVGSDDPYRAWRFFHQAAGRSYMQHRVTREVRWVD